MGEAEEKLDVEQAVARLNEALRLQYRSVNQYMLSSGSLFGFEFQALGDRLWEYAKAELADARRLVEKIIALGGGPGNQAAPLCSAGEPHEPLRRLIESGDAGG